MSELDVPMTPDDGFRKQPVDRRLKRWVLLDGRRWVLAGMVVAAIAVSIYALGRSGAVGIHRPEPANRFFHALIVGNFTIIGLVITINQLILSWEFGSPSDLRDRARGIKEFRQDVERVTDTAVSPARPTEFLNVIIDALRDRAETIDREAARVNGDVGDSLESYAKTVDEYTAQMDDILDRTQFGAFTALSAMLNYNDAWQLHAARQLHHEHRATLSSTARTALEEIIDVLYFFGIARGYFKTLYMERELARLSRGLLYVGVPAVLVAVGAMSLHESAVGAALDPGGLLAVVSVLAALAMLPLAVLFAYALRIATVASRSPTLGSFHTEYERTVKQRTDESDA